MKKAFTLIEVNLAMLIMAGGILSIVGLYSLGFRENSQSEEDVAGAAIADAVMSPIISSLSSTNLRWTVFNNIQDFPSEKGWANYLSNGEVVSNPKGVAESGISKLAALSGNASQVPSIPSGYHYGLVVHHTRDSAVVSIAFRSSKKAKQLMSQPLYYTEVRFQGVQESESK